ncbi:MAG: methyltransferase domain-containing protein [Candidatus Wildermuthbacteria bacterium]|nr:methyltransferase domain-containing protein [Candidatus Wildermuthbacteria bacterium]
MERKRLDLPQLGERLKLVDMGLVMLLARRMNLARLVEEIKREIKQPISRPKIEMERLQDVTAWAERYGLNPEFARAMLYAAIGEACKVQMIQFQQSQGLYTDTKTEEDRRGRLKQNLLEFTELCAPLYDARYDQSFFATKIHAEFEESGIRNLAEEMAGELALDLGCATGRHSLLIAPLFKRVVGYDISPAMVKVAQDKIGSDKHVSFLIHDLEQGIPAENDSASLVVMSIGTASDIPNLPKLFEEIRRVLKPKGKAFLSFYNRGAVLYQWGFVPWKTGLAAEVDTDRQCLDVTWEQGGSEHHFSLFAQSISPEDLETLLPSGLPIVSYSTHPIMAATLPNLLFEKESVRTSVAAIDKRLADEGTEGGAYLTAIVRKT